MPKPEADYYRTINKQKNFARSVGLDSTRFTYPYSTYSAYQDDKSSHYYNADLKLVKSNSVGEHHEDCDEPECGTSNWYCDLCIDLNVDIGFEPAGVSEVYSGCGRSSVQCMLLLECDGEVSSIPHDGGNGWNNDLQLDRLRTDSTPVPLNDEYEPAVVEFAENLDSEQPTIDPELGSAEFQETSSETVDQDTTSDVVISRQGECIPFTPHYIIEVDLRVSVKSCASVFFLSLFLVTCFPVLCLLTNSSILAKASLLTIALFPYTIIFVFDRGKEGRGFSV